MNPVLNYLVTAAVIVFFAVFFTAVGYIAYRALRYKERNSGDAGGGPRVPPAYQPPPPQPTPQPPPPPRPKPRSTRPGRRRR